MPPTVLLTGAAGFIGSHAAERFLIRGWRVVGIDNFDPFYDPGEKRQNVAGAVQNPAFELIEADCSNAESLRAAIAGRSFDVIVHLAAKAGVRPSIEDPMAYTRNNVVATQVMLEVAREMDIQRFILGSSSSVYGNNRKVPFSEEDPVGRPISPYAATKRSAELMAHTYHHVFGMSVLALRFFTVYGPRQRPDLAIRKFATLMLNDAEIPMFGDGSTERDYTWIGDIVDGIVAAVERILKEPPEYQIINLGGNRSTALYRLIEMLADALGVDPRVRRLPMQPGDVDRTFADVEKASRLLDYQPTTPIEEGIPRFADWLIRHNHRTTYPDSSQ